MQIVSLGKGNAVFVFRNGNDFINRIIDQGPYFLDEGQTFIIESVEPGSVIIMTEGGYGFSEQRRSTFESPMPLLSLGLAFSETLFYAFRNSEGTNGLVHVIAGPATSSITLTDATTGNVVLGQSNVVLDPFNRTTLTLDGNKEYKLSATEPIMACIHAFMGAGVQRFYDSRLIIPNTNDGIVWPRNGRVSSLYGNVKVNYYNNQGIGGSFTFADPPVSLELQSLVGNSDLNYDPTGCTRLLAKGLITSFSGADGAGLEATPMVPISAMSYKIPIVGRVGNVGNGATNSITVASPFSGAFRVYNYNSVTEEPEIVTFNDPSGGGTSTIIPIIRRFNVLPDTSIKQRTPCSAQIRATEGDNSYGLQSNFEGGFIISNVPCMVIVNTSQDDTNTYLGSSGNQVPGVKSDGDETIMFGISPDELKSSIRLGSDDLYYRQDITGGVQTWTLA